MQNLYVDTKYMMHKSLKAMKKLLEKVDGQMKEGKDHSEEEMMEARLAPDMFPFLKQVQIVTDNAKGAMARLSGIEIPSYPDTEKNMAELIERLEKTIQFVEGISEEELRKADERKMTLSYFPDKFQTAEDYVRDHAIPNFYFHFVIAYGLLRMLGHDIGKSDFIGGLNLRDM